MDTFVIVLMVIFLFVIAYRQYSSFLVSRLDLLGERVSPQPQVGRQPDHPDDAPTELPILLAQHTSSIAGAGPIIGPIIAGIAFGWLPVFLWILIGNIFIGATHDFAALALSLRYESKSIAEVVRHRFGRKVYRLFGFLIWLSLSALIVVFTNLTAVTFVDMTYGKAIVKSSLFYLLLSLVVGFLITRWRFLLWTITGFAVIFLFFIILKSETLPFPLPKWFALEHVWKWEWVILGYCFVASVLPMRLLLRPNGYLGGYFMYTSLALGLIGLLIGSLLGDVQPIYPPFHGFWSLKEGPLFPMLFVIVACGACSGFHGLVCSGVSSKLIEKREDARLVGYGGMLLEGGVALITLATLMVISSNAATVFNDPTQIYINGLSHILGFIGVNRDWAGYFAILSLATFVYDTLDVATRIGAYLIQEGAGWAGRGGEYGRRTAGALGSLLLPALVLFLYPAESYLAFWPVFAAANQLLAGLTLLVISKCLAGERGMPLYTLIPGVFVLVMALSALFLLVVPWVRSVLQGRFYLDVAPALGIILIVVTARILMEIFKR